MSGSLERRTQVSGQRGVWQCDALGMIRTCRNQWRIASEGKSSYAYQTRSKWKGPFITIYRVGIGANRHIHSKFARSCGQRA